MTSSIYMIRAGEFCKIGKATNPESRINSFRTGNPFRIYPLGTVTVDNGQAALDMEGQLHFYGRELGLHHHNEWFLHDPRLELAFVALGDQRLPNEDPGWPMNLQTIIGNVYHDGWPALEPQPLALSLIGGMYGAVRFWFMGPNGLSPAYTDGWECGLVWPGGGEVWMRQGPSAIYHRHPDGRVQVDTFQGESFYLSAQRIARIRQLMAEVDGLDPP